MTWLRWAGGAVAGVAALLGLRFLLKNMPTSTTSASSGPGSSSLNDRIVREANRVVGLGANTDLDAFEDLLGGPGEDKNTELQMATNPKTSTCGLVVGGIWRRAGILSPKLAPPYHVATAISRLVEIAQPLGAWITDVANYTPEPGDTMMLDVDKPTGHVNTIVGVKKTPTGWELDTVDGGAVDGKVDDQHPQGKQIVRARTHTLTRQGNAMISRSSIGVVHNVTGFVHVRGLEPLTKVA